jgi:hypothetical protein
MNRKIHHNHKSMQNYQAKIERRKEREKVPQNHADIKNNYSYSSFLY